MESKSASAPSTEDDKQNHKPDDTDFQQQRLRAWQPLLTPAWVIGAFFVIGIIFTPIGSSILSASNGVVEVEQQYDHYTPSTCDPIHNRSSCAVTFNVTITDDMDPPVYVYYKLTNFYQNHRRYVSSRSDTQLYGDTSVDPTSTCMSPVGENSINQVYYPCGLIAESMFNDTVNATLYRNDGTVKYLGDASSATSTPDWQKDGIAWTTDVKDKFHALTPTEIANAHYTTYGQWNQSLPSVSDEDFIVWMRTAGLPTFRKLYRKITTETLTKGSNIQFTVYSVYPVSPFSGTKSLVLSTTSWLGGKNSFLGYAYIVVGSICLGVGFLFLVKHVITTLMKRRSQAF